MAIVGVASLAAPATAIALTHEERFDGFFAGTSLTNQVSGVTFPGAPTVFDPFHVPPFSEPNALRATGALTCPGQFADSGAQLRMGFPAPVRSVSVVVGVDEAATGEIPPGVVLAGYRTDNSLARISDVTTLPGSAYQPFNKTVALADGPADISYTVLYVECGPAAGGAAPVRAEIDNLAWVTNEGEPPPQLPAPPVIQLTSPAEGAVVNRPDEVRAAGSVTPAGAVTGLCAGANFTTVPSACNASFDRTSGAFQDLIVPGLRLGENVVRVFARDQYGRVVTAERRVRIDPGARFLDLSVNGIELTQGIGFLTPFQTPVLDPAVTGGRRTVRFNGPLLASRGRTIARVYVDLFSSSGRSLQGMRPVVTLRAFRGGRELPGSPVLPLFAPRVQPGDHNPSDAERADPRSAFTFYVPYTWAQEGTRFKAEVNHAFPLVRECPVCDDNNDLTLIDVPFREPDQILATPYAIVPTRDGHLDRPPPSFDVFRATEAMLPVAEDGFAAQPYVAEIFTGDDLAPPMTPQDRSGWIIGLVAGMEDRFDTSGQAIGIFPDTVAEQAFGKATPVSFAPSFSPFRPLRFETIASAGQRRRFTSVAHEFFHQVGSIHASDCNDAGTPQLFTGWPPDERGEVHGYVLDRRNGSGGKFAPFRVAASNVPQLPSAPDWFDLMSYCGDINGDFDSSGARGNVWISPRRWQGFLCLRCPRTEEPVSGGVSPRNANRRASASLPRVGARGAQAAARSVRVTAIADPAGARIISVSPAPDSTPTGGDAGSPYSYVVRDAAGNVIATVPAGDATPGPPTANFAENIAVVSAIVPADGAETIQLTQNGEELDLRRRTPGAPTVRILSPRRGARIGGRRAVVVRWRTADGDSDQLETRVEYSPNAGRSFKSVAVSLGPQRISLPARLFTASRRGRVRITVSDGLNSASRTVPVRSAGAPPTLAIEAPARRQRVPADSALGLVGSGTDDRGRPLRRRAFSWFLGRRRLARSPLLTVSGLPAGRRRLVLAGRDYRGRVSRVGIPIVVTPVVPRILTLTGPRRIGRSRRVRLRIRASVPARLRVGRIRADVDRRLRTVVIPVPRHRRRVRLRLVLTAAKRQSTTVLRLRR